MDEIHTINKLNNSFKYNFVVLKLKLNHTEYITH